MVAVADSVQTDARVNICGHCENDIPLEVTGGGDGDKGEESTAAHDHEPLRQTDGMWCRTALQGDWK